jgi:DNA-binding response OmpR family regulator
MGRLTAGGPRFRQPILVVESDADACLAVSSSLRAAGYDIDEAEDGVAAWEALQHTAYALMITNQHLLKSSGAELLEQIYDAHLDLPVIMTTKILPTWEFTLHPWLQRAVMLHRPYAQDQLLKFVREALGNDSGGQPGLAKRDWQREPLTVEMAL